MRIISQNGEVDIPYEGSILLLDEKYNGSWWLSAKFPGEPDEYILGDFDTKEDAKAMIISIAKSWMRNYPIFYCTKEEDKTPKERE